MNRKIILLAFTAVLVLTGHMTAWAQTGTHLKGGGHKMPEIVVWYSEPREITDIRLLLQAGKQAAALEKARNYVASLHNVAGTEAEIRRYYGLSALCAALTSSGELPKAIDSCTAAIDIFPTRWQALNNRGVAYYASGQIDKAMQDYSLALNQVQDSEPIMELIQHNIALAGPKK